MIKAKRAQRNSKMEIINESKLLSFLNRAEPTVEPKPFVLDEPEVIVEQEGGSKLPVKKKKPKKPLIKRPKVVKKIKYNINNTGVINGKRYPISDIADLQSEILKIL